MDAKQTVISKRLLSGINFLTGEARRNGIDKIAQILSVCAKDVRTIIKHTVSFPHTDYQETSHHANENDDEMQR
jgi:hypothetical protein